MKNSELIKLIICDVIAVTDADTMETNFEKLKYLYDKYETAKWKEGKEADDK